MKRLILSTAVLVGLGGQAMADCEKEFDALAKAISGPVTMDSGHRAAMMRMAVSSYDSCMAGDSKGSASTRAMIMDQISKSLGGK
jgi:hypothetical protein